MDDATLDFISRPVQLPRDAPLLGGVYSPTVAFTDTEGIVPTTYVGCSVPVTLPLLFAFVRSGGNPVPELRAPPGGYTLFDARKPFRKVRFLYYHWDQGGFVCNEPVPVPDGHVLLGLQYTPVERHRPNSLTYLVVPEKLANAWVDVFPEKLRRASGNP